MGKWVRNSLAAAALSTAALTSVSSAEAATLTIDLSGVDSIDTFGDPDNVFGFFDLGAGAHIIGVGWDLEMFADDPSWLSEMATYFDNTDFASGVVLRPAIGDNFPGTGLYTGYGDLVGAGLDFTLLADGLLYVELFETFDDFEDDWDGFYVSGTISIDYELAAVPEPATWAMMIGGFGLIGGAMRRKTAARPTMKVAFAV